MHDAIVGYKQAAADRYGVSWRAVNNMCVRVANEALGRVDLLDGLVAIAIDEVKYNCVGDPVKGQSHEAWSLRRSRSPSKIFGHLPVGRTGGYEACWYCCSHWMGET